MACISPDGKPTASGAKMLRALKAKAGSAEDVSQQAGLPLFRVRSGLHELAQAVLVTETGGRYEITERGKELIK